MTSQINEYYLYDLRVNDEPEWARAERMEYCENYMDDRHEAGLMNSLRDFFSRLFR